ncbi:hypothetical protein ASG17_03515 [Brevundimonas sp. Leaf363]|uniref:TIGR02300 family protein n=1 Tax=Brevundimonas sp. Leaf363 TaxID=1736353 RepID=UPI0006FBCD9E|nr:TIGR02300 family protein [Brevundimonas sp. Leaf363]KQS56500.1 hypothetical protein ASG17_03515 [Brevundimonas sp. Leaf363]
MANPELGAKQICPNCQAKFYDLNRRPAHCPKCATEFDPEEALKNRRVRGRLAPGYAADDEAEDQVADKKADADEEDEDEAVTAPEIDEEGHEPILTPDDDDESTPADASEEAGMGTTDGDDDDVLADDDDDDVPFIEDEDEDNLDGEISRPGKDED